MHVTGRLAFDLDKAATGEDMERLAERMGVPGSAGAWGEGDADRAEPRGRTGVATSCR